MPLDILVGMQWGDEGKGRITDLLASDADIVARFSGGDNAGHTITRDNQTFKLHLVPSGIVYQDKICVMGNGMVINPVKLEEELNTLADQGIDISPDRLKISSNAHVLTEGHIKEDITFEALRGDNSLGTTKRGIGPAYASKIARFGMQMKYIDDPFIQQYVIDTSEYLYDALLSGKTILAEGAQGTMLDIDHGSYPFVTSASVTAGGALTGLGIGPQHVRRVIGVAKAFSARVGAGPMPSEVFGDEAVRLRGTGSNPWDEFGTTTGRARRVGWLDLDVLKYAVRINGITEIALTKLDILSGLEDVPVYANGKNVSLRGWREDITNTRTYLDLPREAQAYIGAIELVTNTPVTYISVGPEREQVILG